MTRVLYLVADGPHAHCYGTDYLLAGFYNVLGFDNVFDWPEKENVHLPNIAARDDCQIASDACYLRKNLPLADILPQVDVAILTAPAPQLSHVCRALPSSVPIVAVDGSDYVGSMRQPYEQIAGRPLAAYFKRELALGESYALPLPLSYPASLVPVPMPEKRHGVFYHATYHGGGAPGLPRIAIAEALGATWAAWVDEPTRSRRADAAYGIGHAQRVLWRSSENTSILLTPGQAKGTRAEPEAYHAEMARWTIGIHFNCAQNWDANRWGENFAYGLCQVAERPRIQILHQPEDGKHCIYVDRPEQVAPAVLELLNDEPRAREIAQAGHAHFLRYHSSERRAEHILSVVGKLGA